MLKITNFFLTILLTSTLFSSVKGSDCVNIDDISYKEWLDASPRSYNNSVFIPSVADSCKGLIFNWQVDVSSSKLKIAVATKAKGWIGIGFSENGGMKGSDIVYFEAASGTLIDAYVTDFVGAPLIDESQDWALLDSHQADGYIFFEGERALDTGDVSNDYKLVDDSDLYVTDHRIIGAWGDQPSIGYHGRNRVKTVVQLFPNKDGTPSGDSYELFLQDMASRTEGSVILKLDGYVVPTDETTYYEQCFNNTQALANKKLSSDSLSSTFLVGFEFFFDESMKKYVHHIVVMGHPDGEPGTSVDSCSGNVIPLFGWAPGNNFFQFPHGMGLNIGNIPNSIIPLTVQYHFDNKDHDQGVIDNSTVVKMYYSTQPLAQEVGLLSVGDALIGLLGEPVGVSKTMHEFICPSSCTQSHIDNDVEITIFQEGHHMHSNGKRMVNEIYRDGILLHSASIEYWDYDQTGTAKTRQQPYTIKAGDSFKTTCYFENDDENTTFGLASSEEMCITFIYYYPKQNAFACAPNNESDESCSADYTVTQLGLNDNLGRVFDCGNALALTSEFDHDHFVHFSDTGDASVVTSSAFVKMYHATGIVFLLSLYTLV